MKKNELPKARVNQSWFPQAHSTPNVPVFTTCTSSVTVPTTGEYSHCRGAGCSDGQHRKAVETNPVLGGSYGKTFMKPATYDGVGSWIDYRAHFEACSDINMWNDRQKSLYLAASLRGQAQTVLGNMKSGTACTYMELCDALESRFAPANQTELYRAMLREKRQKAAETLPELGESIRRLAHLAYPTAPREVTEMIAKDQFVDALIDFDMRLRIQQSRPKSLNDAIRLAVEIEAFSRAERQRRPNVGFARGAAMDQDKEDSPEPNVREEFRQLRNELQASMRDLENKLTRMISVSTNEAQKSPKDSGDWVRPGSFPYKCHHCGKRGHRIKDCFKKNRQGQ